MRKTWTAAIAVMVLMQGAHAAPTAAEALPEAHTLIGAGCPRNGYLVEPPGFTR